MDMSKSQKGAIAEAMVMAKLLEHGIPVFVPFGQYGRYDLLAEYRGFKKIQVKSAPLKEGSIQFRTYSVTARGKSFYTADEVDLFGVYCPDNGSVYLVPFEDCAAGGISRLRVDPCRNGQANGVRWAKCYLWA